MQKNQELYNKPETVKEYGRIFRLTPPERTILEIIKRRGGGRKMLDIGVGTGRTTPFFAPFFNSYTGIDYSPAMIAECNMRFGNNVNLTFTVGDARNMNFLADNSFDFVLFSFNGIDFIPAAERTVIFSEILRVGKTEFVFAFSTHNHYYLPFLFSFRFPRNPLRLRREWRRYKGIRKNNAHITELLSMEYAGVRDGDQNFEAEHIYCKPEAQIGDMEDAGFENIRVFSLNSGKELPRDTVWSKHNDAWLYYMADRKNQPAGRTDFIANSDQ